MRRWTRRGLLALIALLVLWFFEGWLPVGGSREGSTTENEQAPPQESAPDAPDEQTQKTPEERTEPSPEAAKGATPEPDSDALAGLRAKLDWLLSQGELLRARTLAERIRREGGEAEQKIGDVFLGRLDQRGAELERDLRAALGRGEVARAEELLRSLEGMGGERAARVLASLPGAGAADATPLRAFARLLPLPLAEGLELARLRGDVAILRERGERGWTYREQSLSELMPARLADAIRDCDASEGEQDAAWRACAGAYARAGRPLAAGYLRSLCRTEPASPKGRR